jgi:hypothetical protein
MISSLLFAHSDPRILIDVARHAAVARYLVVGGAGSLQTTSGQAVIEAGLVPAPYLDESRAGGSLLGVAARNRRFGLDLRLPVRGDL